MGFSINEYEFDPSSYRFLDMPNPMKKSGYMEALVDVQNFLQTIDTEDMTGEECRKIISRYARYKEYGV